MDNNQRDAPKMITVIRGPLAIAFDEYILDPTSKKKILDEPIEIEFSAIINEWLEVGKLVEYKPQVEEKEQ